MTLKHPFAAQVLELRDELSSRGLEPPPLAQMRHSRQAHLQGVDPNGPPPPRDYDTDDTARAEDDPLTRRADDS